jgi:hypothetical protein
VHAVKFKICAFQEIEQARFKENRDQVLKRYENMLKKQKEETERCKRDIQGYQQKLLKDTPTPNKSQCEVRVILVAWGKYFKQGCGDTPNSEPLYLQ